MNLYCVSLLLISEIDGNPFIFSKLVLSHSPIKAEKYVIDKYEGEEDYVESSAVILVPSDYSNIEKTDKVKRLIM